MRSFWNGTIGVSLLTVPVKLGPVVSEEKSPVHKVRKSDGSRIEMRRFAKADGAPVDYDQLTDGYDTGSGIVMLSADDFRAAYGDRSREAKVLMFADVSALPREAHGASYFVQPGPGGGKAYRLLHGALSRAGKAAVVSVALSARTACALLRPAEGGYLVLERLEWAANVRRPDFAAPSEDVTEAEAAMADQLVASLSGEFDWASAKDEGAERLAAVVRAKAEAGEVTAAPASGPGTVTPPADLMAVLAESVAAAKAARAPARKPRARKAAAA